MKTIIIQAAIASKPTTVWQLYTEPEHITKWAFASDDWEAPQADNDVRPGGRFKTHMRAKDGSTAFDFAGTYTAVKEHECIEYDMDDNRHARVRFEETPEGTKISITFDAEEENSIEMQRQGWQAILDNFKKYVEANN